MTRGFFALMLACCLLWTGCQASSQLTGTDNVSSATEDTSQVHAGGLSTLSNWVQCSGIVPVYDRNHGDTDRLLIFYLPVNYSPAWMHVRAYNWYGVLGMPNVDLHEVSYVNGRLRVKYLASSRVMAWYSNDPSHYYLEYP